MVPHLKPTDTAAMALEVMEDFRLKHLPVVKEGLYLGMVMDEKLLLMEPDAFLHEVELEKELASVSEDTHLFEIIKILAESQAGVVTVLDHERKFMGVIGSEDVISALSQAFTVQSEGTVIVVEMYMRDLHLSEIMRIVEAENVKVMGIFTQVHEEDPSKIYLTIKFNRRDTSRAVAALERFQYTIVAEFNVQRENDIDQERLGNLMRYLNV